MIPIMQVKKSRPGEAGGRVVAEPGLSPRSLAPAFSEIPARAAQKLFPQVLGAATRQGSWDSESCSPARDPRHSLGGGGPVWSCPEQNNENCVSLHPVLGRGGHVLRSQQHPWLPGLALNEQIVLLCHSQLGVCQLGSLRGEAGRPGVELPLICPAQGFLLSLVS